MTYRQYLKYKNELVNHDKYFKEKVKQIEHEKIKKVYIPPSLLFYEYKPWYAWVYGGERNPMSNPPVWEYEDDNPTP